MICPHLKSLAAILILVGSVMDARANELRNSRMATTALSPLVVFLYPSPPSCEALIRLRESTNLRSGKATTRAKRRITARVERAEPLSAIPARTLEAEPLP